MLSKHDKVIIVQQKKQTRKNTHELRMCCLKKILKTNLNVTEYTSGSAKNVINLIRLSYVKLFQNGLIECKYV